MANRGVNYPLLGLAFIGLAIAKLLTVYWEMEKRVPKSPFGSEGCVGEGKETTKFIDCRLFLFGDPKHR